MAMLFSLLFAVQWIQQWQGDFLLPSRSFHAVGLVREERIPGAPGEKWKALRLHYGVVTQGGECQWEGVLLDSRQHVLMRINDRGTLPKGEADIVIEVPGGQIEAFATTNTRADAGPAEGPLVLANMEISCGDPIAGLGFMDPRHYETAPVHAKDFQHQVPDFKLTMQPRYSGHVGEAVAIQISREYLGSWRGTIDMHLENLPAGVIPSAVSKDTSGFYPRISPSAVPGIYPVRVVARSGAIEHSRTFELEILPARELLFPLDGATLPTPSKPIISGTPPSNTIDVGATFRVETNLRPMNVVLVVQHGRSLSGPRCDAMKQLATYFVQQFVEGRDNVGVVGFNDGVFIVDPLRGDFKTGPVNTLSRIANLRCEGSGGVHTYALEVAHQQLQARNDPKALNIIVMLASAPPSKVAALWPIRTQADRRYLLDVTGEAPYRTPDQEVDLAPSPCSDTTSWRASFAPTSPAGFFSKPDAEIPALLPIPNDCALSQPRAGLNAFRQDIAYIPEVDLLGVPFSGALSLERFTSGPYAGHIRPDSEHNLRSSAVNNLINAARAAREDTRIAPMIAVIAIKGVYSALTGRMTPELLAQLAGEDGVAYLADQLEDFPKGFSSIFANILHRAQAK